MQDPAAPAVASTKGPLWAYALSGLFHPLLMASYMYLLLLLINPFLFGANGPGNASAMLTLVMMVLYTFVIPLVSVLIMRGLNMISSIMMEERTERIGPMLLVMILYFWVGYNLVSNGDTPLIFSVFLTGVTIALAVAFVVNVVEKISLHTLGMGGLTGMVALCVAIFGGRGLSFGNLTLSLGLLLILVVLLAGLVGSARLALRAHTPPQLYAGYFVGLSTQLLAYFLYF